MSAIAKPFLRNIAHNIWVAKQPLNYMGLNVGTRMTVIRLSNQRLVVISPIEPTEALEAELSSLGAVGHIIAPNLYHYLYAERFKACYPDAILWATDGLKQKKPSLPIDKTLQLDDSDLWHELELTFFGGLRTLGFNGFDSFNEWVFFHAASRTLVLTDAAFHYDAGFPFIEKLGARVLGCYEMLSPSVLEKVATKDRQQLKASVEKVLLWDFDRVIVAHGSVIERGGKELFRSGYARFLS
ncbi:MAG: DUF4336 domain-containing protein [Cyanobacteria bacterium J06576_12]